MLAKRQTTAPSRINVRYYLCTEVGPVRLPRRLACDLSEHVIALPQFANSVKRMVEVLIQSKHSKIEKLELRPTHSRFDENGKIDLRHAAEAMAIILGGSARRPQLAAALSEARRQRCYVGVAKLDRLSRDVHLISGLMAHRVPLWSLNLGRTLIRSFCICSRRSLRRNGR